jgi:hypothetical protein
MEKEGEGRWVMDKGDKKEEEGGKGKVEKHGVNQA